MKYEYFLVPKSNIFGSSPCNYFTKQKDFSTKTFLLNEILFYQLFLVVSPYYHLLLPALQNTQYHNHLQRKGEVLSYEKVNVEEKLFKSFFAFPRNSGVLNILIGVVFFTFFLLICVILQLLLLPTGDLWILLHSMGLFFFALHFLSFFFTLHFIFF